MTNTFDLFMTDDQLQSILKTGAVPGGGGNIELVETHISWVILTSDFAFKLKKPLTLGFLDFSTLEKRHFFCQEELRLNRRLAPEMYLDVLPVGIVDGEVTIGAAGVAPIDYALQMRRMDNQLQMDKLLADGAVTRQHMVQLAEVLVPFHQSVLLPDSKSFHPAALWSDFADLFRFSADIVQQLGAHTSTKLAHWRDYLPAFLEKHSERLLERRRDGFWVDGHGDLHTRNIFLTKKGPAVFDCIEFSTHYRQSDILNELAFLCMDLEAQGHAELADVFLQGYTRRWNVFPKNEDHHLFLFFKAYRANVRLKIALLALRQHPTKDMIEQVRQYWQLMAAYLDQLDLEEL
ncbi:MAG: phosphotransferase [Lewinellaceae bacterium]|nr:phosphotransferase [Saprospiraceae bacterium]MCB9332303.1 phosphotransferase [Lewinellaceae bacterium]